MVPKQKRSTAWRQFAEAPQHLVNHASQAIVNHDRQSRPSNARLTPNIKPIRTHLRHDLAQRPGT